MESITSKAVLEAIQRRAIERWGQKGWRDKLAHEYVRIAQKMGDSDATYNGRRRQVRRVFEVYSCTLETAITLAAAVGCRFQLACTEITIEEF
jgi:hypothetical protein